MENKICFKCNKEKVIEEFYRHSEMADGRLNKCKDCAKKDVSENYFKNRDYYVKYDRSRLDDPKRKKANREYSRWLRKNDPERVKRYQLNYNKNKKKASTMVNNAVRDKRLKKESCIVCGNKKSEGHHKDYTKPLEVIWLCRKHHGEIYRKLI